MKNFSADTQQEHHCIESLPGELQKEIVHRLPFKGIDLSSFKEACLVSHYWLSLVQNLSRDLLRRYFPYLAVVEPQHFTDDGYRLLFADSSKKAMLKKGIIYLNQNSVNQLEYKVITPENKVATGVFSTIQNVTEALTLEKLTELKPQILQETFAKRHTSANAPLKLLAVECRRYRKWFPLIDIALVLAALSGEKEIIATVKDKDTKICLYALLIANGHSASLTEFKDFDKTCILGKALRYAALNGHIEIVDTLLKERGAEIAPVDKSWAFRNAALNGHTEIITLLLEKVAGRISADDKRRALTGAAKKGYTETVKILLQKVGRQITADDKGCAFQDAALGGHTETVNAIFKKVGGEISAYDKGRAFQDAAIGGHAETLNALLMRVEREITARNKQRAFLGAALNGHVEIVKFLLKKVGAQISTQVKDQAMNGALPEIVHLILRYQAKEALIKSHLSQNRKAHFFRTIFTGIFNVLTYRSSLAAGVGCALTGFLALNLSAVACLFMLTSITLGIEVIKKLARDSGELAHRNKKHLMDMKLRPLIQKGTISEFSWRSYCLDVFTTPSSMLPAFLSNESEAYQMGREMARKEKAHDEMKARKRRCR